MALRGASSGGEAAALWCEPQAAYVEVSLRLGFQRHDGVQFRGLGCCGVRVYLLQASDGDVAGPFYFPGKNGSRDATPTCKPTGLAAATYLLP